MERVLLIYINRATNKYERYEVCPIDKITIEEVHEKVSKYNNSNQDTYIKVYESSFWLDFIDDVSSSFSRRNLVNCLKDTVSELRDCIESLESFTDDIEEILE